MIPDCPGYRVGNDGTVWSQRNNRWGLLNTWHQLRPGLVVSNPKYARHMVSLGRGNQRFVHHLILEAFVGPRPDGYESCHKNGNPLDNRLVNLYWGTKRDNGLDTRAHGRKKGEKHPLATLTDALVRMIRYRATNGETHQSIADDLGIQRRNVGRIADKSRWGHVK